MRQLTKHESPAEIHILVCLSASPSNQKVIRSAARFAQGRSGIVTALFVDNGKVLMDDAFLNNNMELAKSFGASVEIIVHKDVLGAITEYAKNLAVTDLFIGYSGPSRKTFFRHLPAYKLVQDLPDVDVHIIPDASALLHPSGLEPKEQHRLNIRDFLRTGSVMAIATILSYLFDKSPFSNSNIITIYILAVLITSMLTAERIYGIIAAILYILLFNFLFIEPRFTFLVYDPNYLFTYLISIIAAVITGNVSTKMKQLALQARSNAYQAQILLNASELFQRSQNEAEITGVATGQLKELLEREIRYFPVEKLRESICQNPSAEEQTIPTGQTFSPEQMVSLDCMTKSEAQNIESFTEQKALRLALEKKQRTGWGTRYYTDAEYQYLTVQTGSQVYGVIAVAASRGEMNSFEENILLSLISEYALALENEKNRKEREEAQIIAENERFRSKLLRSISHDLRTPLTSISGNAANLLSHARELSDVEKERIYQDISKDSNWLIELVENLLSITRLENNMEIHSTGEVVADVLATAVSNGNRHLNGHQIELDADTDFLVARMDVPLILQVLNNLISNAVKHTPPSTKIRISDYRKGDQVIIRVEDDGPGIPEKDKPFLFDLFFSGSRPMADSNRSLGLGLNLCKSILAAHGQEIHVEDVKPHGTAFEFSLELWKDT